MPFVFQVTIKEEGHGEESWLAKKGKRFYKGSKYLVFALASSVGTCQMIRLADELLFS